MASTRTRSVQRASPSQRGGRGERRPGDDRRDKAASQEELLFGRYRLEERLGMGGSAEVWRAHDEQLDRQVALKLLHRHLLPDEASRARFAAEARAAARLSHPGIITVHDIATDDERAGIVLELVPGQSLADRLALGGRLPPVAAADVAAQVAEALEYAHQEGLIHRDVKPGNILIDEQGRARLVDFGIAAALTGPKSDMTTAGTVMGTLRYLSPEQLAGERATAGADIWGLGAVLYEMLEARPPFEARSPVALAAEQRHPPPEPAGPARLARLAVKALAFERADRPGSAGEVAGELRRWLAEEAPDLEARVIPIVSAVAAANPTLEGVPGAHEDRIVERRAAAQQPDADEAGVSDDTASTAVLPLAVGAAAPQATPAAATQKGRLANPRRPTRRAAVLIALGLAFVAALGLAGALGSGPPRDAGAATSPSPEATAKPTPTATPRSTPRPAAQPPKGKDHKKGKGDGGGD